MNRKKQWIIIILLMMVLFCLSACQESNESKYNRANKLMTEGKYEESVKLFDEISTYEDSSKMAMYGKAIAAAESGDYKKAFSSFNALGDFKDCPMMITYYTARQYESQATDTNWIPRLQAAETFDTVALFLDSAERAEKCRKTVYDMAVAYAAKKQYAQSMEMLAALHDYEDSELLRRYYEAFDLEQNNKFTEASRSFRALGDYKDSTEQAAEVLKRGYQAADALEKSGDQEAAYEIWIGLGEYSDSFARANKSQYDLGVTLRDEKQWDEAVAAFEHAGTYSDAETQVKETKYLQALDRREKQNWNGALEIFRQLGDYKNSSTTQISETRYQKADALEKSGDQEAAYEIWIDLGDYNDSFARANKPYYDLGVTLREEEKWDEAIAAFAHAGNYDDSADQILMTRYAEGISKREAQDWDGAREAFAKAGNYSDAAEQNKEMTYQQTKAFMTDGDYSGAYRLLLTLKEYKDVDDLLKNDANLVRESYRTPGSMVRFGRYEQDNNTANGPEEIDWIVLDYDEANHKALLLSKYGLNTEPYNTKWTDITWEKCTLRSWLNGEFLNKAFSMAEQSAILTSTVDNSKSQGYSGRNTDGGNNTEDQIFLLSYAEANRYLNVTIDDKNNLKSRVAPTAYALAQGAWTNDSNKTEDGTASGWWWLRSPGSYQDYAAFVDSDGSLDGCNVDYVYEVVRPAFWLNLESGIF